MKKSDIIIIGSGPGGYRAAEYAARNGLSVTIVEATEAGGTCLNHGCIPTKTLCRNAEIIDTLRQAEIFGIGCDGNELDFAKVMNRKQSVVSQLRNGVEALMQSSGINMVCGLASFIDSRKVVVNNEEYTADNIIIATGSSPKCPPIEGIELSGVVSSKEMLNIASIPERLCIIGAGVIGMEFASIFSSFGSKVTVIEFLKECIPALDSDIAKRLRQTIGKRGVDFFMQSSVKSIYESKDTNSKRQLTVSFEKKGKQQNVNADIVLVATGRKPNTCDLNLEAAGVEYTQRGIVTDAHFMTNVTGIYAIGDVNGHCMLAHAATYQGLHVVNQILGEKDKIRFDIMPSAIFTYPEAACVGISEDQLKAEGRQYVCRKGFYRSNGKAIAMNETDGMIKLLSDPNDCDRIIGCHAYGAHSADIIQGVTALMNEDATVQQLVDTICIHPTLSEILHDTACKPV